MARANGRRGSQKALKDPTRGKERPEGPEEKPEGLKEGPRQNAKPEVSPRGASGPLEPRGDPGGAPKTREEEPATRIHTRRCGDPFGEYIYIYYAYPFR